jgi:hypothetical protein
MFSVKILNIVDNHGNVPITVDFFISFITENEYDFTSARETVLLFESFTPPWKTHSSLLVGLSPIQLDYSS